MAGKITVPIKGNKLPPISIGGHDFLLRMTASEVMARMAAAMDTAKAMDAIPNDVKKEWEGDPEDMPRDMVEAKQAASMTMADVATAGQRLIEAMFGEGAYQKITAGSYYTFDEDLGIVQSVMEAIGEFKAQERRERNAPESAKKSKAAGAK